jgi:hypothetical protein
MGDIMKTEPYSNLKSQACPQFKITPSTPPLSHISQGLFLGGLALLLSACVSAPEHKATTLSSIDGLTSTKSGRTAIKEKRETKVINQVKTVFLEPVKLATSPTARYALSEDESKLVTLEVEAQLCFELSERFLMAANATEGDAIIRAAVTWFEPTGALSSGAAALAGKFIPGPLDLRIPGSLGGLGAEAEMLKGDQQIAAIVWARRAQAIGTDTPSLSRLGDALQFAEPFGDDASRVMSPDPLPPKLTYTSETDPCARYGSRFDAAGFVTGRITGLFNPTDRDKAKKE